ncbi:hypothetical protein NONI108955_29830 [Nocardia ninae]|uniref:Secreted protein n=1 Tax=Nocardia ninae NBRC 108245 TaxID=1210091 RepID=A0A511MH39_9NOCA|nr:hypothetical protein [Nocardia ninae]GEM39751.1 hypothetical protein NN4_42700 [Nocardia ninae NBRC 108245]
MKKTIAGLAVATMLLAPATATAATPLDHPPATLVADSGSAATGSAGEYLCRLLKMLRAGWVDSSGGGPACTFP